MIMSRLFRSAKGKGVAKFHSASKEICEMLKSTVDHNNLRVVGLGLRVIGHFISTLEDADGKLIPQFSILAKPFHTAIHQHLSKQ